MNKKYMIDRVTRSGKYYVSGSRFGTRKAWGGMVEDAGPGLNYHVGVDYGTPVGVKLYAPADGYFVKTCRDGHGAGYGNYILFYIPSADITVHLAHLSNIEPLEGVKLIKEGTFIGNTGNTGLSSGPHLHLGVARGKKTNLLKGKIGDGTWINPSTQDYSKLGVAPKPSFEQVVKDVILGKYGNGAARVKAIEKVGHSPSKVQAEVNRRLSKGTTSVKKPSFEQVVKDVILGKYGNGAARVKAIEKVGHSPSKVQAEVNRRLR